MEESKQGVFSSLNPKSGFFGGVISSILMLCTIGFFILLAIVLKNNEVDTKTNQLSAPSFAEDIPIPAPYEDIIIKPISKNEHIKGNRNAPISIIEFSDTECPFCARFHPTLQQIVDQYDGQVNWIYRHFPLRNLHSKAAYEAEATECAAELAGNDGFWAYLDRLFEITPSNDGLDKNKLPEIAEYVGINKTKFQDCLESGRMADIVKDHEKQAVAAGGRGTPHSIILGPNGETIPLSGAVPASQVQSVIDSLLSS